MSYAKSWTPTSGIWCQNSTTRPSWQARLKGVKVCKLHPRLWAWEARTQQTRTTRPTWQVRMKGVKVCVQRSMYNYFAAGCWQRISQFQWRIQDFPLGGQPTCWGGHWPLTCMLFGKNMSENERIRSANEFEKVEYSRNHFFRRYNHVKLREWFLLGWEIFRIVFSIEFYGIPFVAGNRQTNVQSIVFIVKIIGPKIQHDVH